VIFKRSFKFKISCLLALLVFNSFGAIDFKTKVGTAVRLHLDEIRPSQTTIGRKSVEKYNHKIRTTTKDIKLMGLLERKRAPIVIPPPEVARELGGRAIYFVLNRQNWLNALTDLGFEEGLFVVELNFSELTPTEFWRQMETNYLHLFDFGHPIGRLQLPAQLQNMRKSAWRDIVEDLESRKFIEKHDHHHSACKWENFIIQQLGNAFNPESSNAEYERSYLAAVALSQTQAASHLPGFKNCPKILITRPPSPRPED
jgi:hypothetical protein